MPLVWWKPVVAALASVGALHAVVHTQRDRVNLFFMKFFRDLGRYKALKRRRGDHDDKGLLAFLSSREDPLQELLQLDAEAEDEWQLETYTTAELWELGNHDSDDGTLLLAILGRVYDVTEGDKFYGPTGNYGAFAGRDVTYALATGCSAPRCVETDWTALKNDKDANNNNNEENDPSAVFTDAQLLEAKKWLSFFHLHDKYPLVGKLEGDSFDALVQQLLADDDENDTASSDEALTEEDMLRQTEPSESNHASS